MKIEKKNMIKKITLIILLIFTTISIANSAGDNSSFDEIELDYDGFCPNFDIEFKIYNKTDYDNMETIEDNLCDEDETPEDDGCQVFNKIVGDVKIYDGPLDSRPVLLNTKSNSEGIFTFKFTSGNDYLIEVVPEGNYKDLSIKIPIEDCMRATNNPDRIVDEPETPETFNQTFSYDNYEHIIKLENTEIEFKENITITTDVAVATPLENAYKTFEISGDQSKITVINFETSVTEEEVILEVHKYDSNLGIWTLYDPAPIKKINRLEFDIVEFGIYAIKEKEEEIEAPVVEEKPVTEPETPVVQEKTPVESIPVVEDKGVDFSKAGIILGAILGGGLIVGFMVMPKKHESKYNYHDYKNPIINSEVYNKTKQYVQKFKPTYNKMQIKMALEKANIDSQIIEKVLNEEFPTEPNKLDKK